MSKDDIEVKAEALRKEVEQRKAKDEKELAEHLRKSTAFLGLVAKHSHFILDGEKVKRVDFAEWAAWFEYHELDRIVARTVVQEGIEVSTVFLGLDRRNWAGEGKPILFETMVFGGMVDREMWRYASYAAARKGHWKMVKRVKAAEAGERI